MDKGAGSPDEELEAVRRARQELAELHRAAACERAVLARLHREVAAGQAEVHASAAATLVEANAQLVQAVLQARDEVEHGARAVAELMHSNGVDLLTALPNRARFLSHAGHAVAHARRYGGGFALLFLDLDDFKRINDALGHAIGDEVLRLAATRLAATVRETDIASRYGGDEFLVLLDGVASLQDAQQMAARILAAMAKPTHIGDQRFSLSASIGISLYPDDADDVEALIACADASMYRAKHGKAGVGTSAVHDHGAATKPVGEAPAPSQLDVCRDALNQHEQRNLQLREANQRLVLAALVAQEKRALAISDKRQQQGFLTSVARELKAPLAAIQGAAGMLGRLPSPASHLVAEDIMLSATRMTRLVGDVLDVARIDAGRIRLHSEMLDMRELIDTAAVAIGPVLLAKRQHLDRRMPSDALELFGDRDRLLQVLGNLLDNACRFSPVGGRIELQASLVEDLVVVAVADEGVGIDPGSLARIFELFTTDGGTDVSGPARLGIGLAVVREVVSAHGGEVAAWSAGPGSGARFELTLPRSSGTTGR